MNLGVFQRTIVDNSGDTIATALVEVRREDTGALVPLWADREGTIGVSNPAHADPDGFIQFYAEQGSYRIKATSGGFSRIWRHQPLIALGLDGTVGAFKVVAKDATVARTLAVHLGEVYNAKDFGAVGDGTTDDTAAIQAALDAAAAAGGGIVLLRVGTYLISSTLVLKARVHLAGEAANLVTIRLADNANVTMLETFKFDALRAIDAYDLNDDPDFTFGFGIRDIIFDGNFNNQSPSGLIYGLRLYGRRYHLQSVQIADVRGIGLWTIQNGAQKAPFDFTDTRMPGGIDDVNIVNCLDEAWIFQGPDDIPIGSFTTNNNGDATITTPVQTSRFPDWVGEEVHALHIDGAFHAKYLNLNGARFGRGLNVRSGQRIEIDHVIASGNWGNVKLNANCFGKIDQIVSQANPLGQDGNAHPHVENAAQDVQFSNIIVRRVNGHDSAAPGVVDTGGAQFGRVLGRNGDGIPGHGVILAGPRSRVDDVLMEGLRGTASDGNPSVGVRIDSGASYVRVMGSASECDVGFRNQVNNLDGIFDLLVIQNVGRGDVAFEGLVGAPALDDVSLKKARLLVLQANPSGERKNSFQGSLPIDITSTANQALIFNHSMLRAPTIDEISLSLEIDAVTPPTLDYLFVKTISATQVLVWLKFRTAGATPTTQRLAAKIN